MNVNLTPEFEEFVKQKVATGLYNSASEVLREALRLLEERDRLRMTRYEELKKEIAIGLKQLEEGKVSIFDAKRVREKVRNKTKSRKR